MTKRIIAIVCVGAGLIGLVTSCEWSGSGDSNSWSDKYSWVNFSGVYRSADGGPLVRVPVQPSTLVSNTVRHTTSAQIGTGDGVQRSFTATLTAPVAQGSVSVTDGFEAFTDTTAPGTMTGDKGGTGTIDYNTGFLSVTFQLEPAASVAIMATYDFEELVTGGSPASSPVGSSLAVFSLTVFQQGNQLTITDSNGATYAGKMGSLSSSGGFSNGQVLDGSTVIAQFSASGTSANGRSIKIVGTLEGTYRITSTTGGGTSSTTPGATVTQWRVEGRTLDGTWIENGGAFTGNIHGQAATSSATSTGGTNTTSSGF